MVIDDRYINLLNVLIHDKRTKMNGILSSLEITRFTGGEFRICYKAYMSKRNSDMYIFVEDFKKGNVVFLLPFGVKYMEEELDEMAEHHTSCIKEFFGKDFREDMLMRISEDKRQEEIRKTEQILLGLENWDSVCQQ